MRNLLKVTIQYDSQYLHQFLCVNEFIEILDNCNLVNKKAILDIDDYYYDFIIDIDNMVYYQYKNTVLNRLKFSKTNTHYILIMILINLLSSVLINLY